MSHTKERPILMSGPMVRALLEGRKTQTRRACKGQRELSNIHDFQLDRCPYGKPGQKLWVRETFSGPHCMEATEGRAAVPPSKWDRSSHIWYWADGNPESGDWTKPRASIFMPRWASRILLEITDVRVERLQDISEGDAIAEGWEPLASRNPGNGGPFDWYRSLWESINGAGSWDANPFVWVIIFKRIEG